MGGPAMPMVGMTMGLVGAAACISGDGRCQAELLRLPLWSNENPDPCGPGFCSSKRVASSDSPLNSGKATPNVQGC